MNLNDMTPEEIRTARQLIAVVLGTGETEYPDVVATLAEAMGKSEADADKLLHIALPPSRPVPWRFAFHWVRYV